MLHDSSGGLAKSKLPQKSLIPLASARGSVICLFLLGAEIVGQVKLQSTFRNF